MPKSNPIANLQVITKCPMCDFKYDRNDIKVVDKKQETVSLYLNCKQCKSSITMVILAGMLGVTSISVMTDAVEDDLKKIGNSYINYDDVLEIHKFLKNK